MWILGMFVGCTPSRDNSSKWRRPALACQPCKSAILTPSLQTTALPSGVMQLPVLSIDFQGNLRARSCRSERCWNARDQARRSRPRALTESIAAVLPSVRCGLLGQRRPKLPARSCHSAEPLLARVITAHPKLAGGASAEVLDQPELQARRASFTFAPDTCAAVCCVCVCREVGTKSAVNEDWRTSPFTFGSAVSCAHT
jgi:hypothetical protein